MRNALRTYRELNYARETQQQSGGRAGMSNVRVRVTRYAPPIRNPRIYTGFLWHDRCNTLSRPARRGQEW